ncbi:MAG: LytTR family DNA-binding domain-containing protein [Lachnospiraceae bacterium]|nr:LytTR family DNA-binding domain-containing protein [Ruminococcus sp.]MCM1275390.1 LytTR family DNA-binding domain-containing protein [Lachnospiraceae bacterium]
MKIAVVDDIAEERERARSYVRKYAGAHGLTAEISEFSSAEEFLAADESFDIALLDIYMNEMNGIDAARESRAANGRTELIFLTTSRDFAVEAFEVNAANYLVKPYSEERLFAALDGVLREKAPEPTVTLRCESGLRTFELRAVEFFEVQKHALHINLSDGKRETARLSMKQLRAELGENTEYIPCGASFFVNLRYIVSLNNFTLATKTGRKIPVPRRSVSEIEKAYLDYCRRAVGK